MCWFYVALLVNQIEIVWEEAECHYQDGRDDDSDHDTVGEMVTRDNTIINVSSGSTQYNKTKSTIIEYI